MKKWLSDTKNLIYELRKYVLIVAALSILSFFSGAYLSGTHLDSIWLNKQFNPVENVVKAYSLGTGGIIISILGRNIGLTSVLILTSPLHFGLLSCISFLGTMFKLGGQVLWYDNGKSAMLLDGFRIYFTHSIFEILAILLSTSLSLRIGKTFIFAERGTRTGVLHLRSLELFRLTPIIVGLFTIAAIIEGTVSLPQAKSAVERVLMTQETKIVMDDSKRWSIEVPKDWSIENTGKLNDGSYETKAYSNYQPLRIYMRRTNLPDNSQDLEGILNWLSTKINAQDYEFVNRPEPVTLSGKPAIKFTYYIKDDNHGRDYNISYAVISPQRDNNQVILYRIDEIMPAEYTEVSIPLFNKLIDKFRLN